MWRRRLPSCSASPHRAASESLETASPGCRQRAIRMSNGWPLRRTGRPDRRSWRSSGSTVKGPKRYAVLTGTAGVASSRRSYACRVLPALGEFHTSVQWLCVVRIAKLSVFPGDEHPVPSSKPLAVIDDDRSVREAIVALLRSHGHATEGFDSADQFIQSFQP